MAAISTSARAGGNGYPHLISDDDYNQVVAFTRTPCFLARRDRVSEYFRADPTQEIALRMLKVGGAVTASSVVTFAAIGACAGGPKGALIGAGIGLGTGIIFTIVYSSKDLRQNYQDWKAGVEDKCVVDKIREIHHEHFDNFVCPLSHEIMKDPVQTLCGHTFERIAIEKWIDMKIAEAEANTDPSKKIEPHCPTCRTFLTKDELNIDLALLGQAKKAYGEYAAKESENPAHSAEIKKGFEALHTDLEIQTTEILKQASVSLALQLSRGEITAEAFSRKMREVTSMFTDSSDSGKTTSSRM